MAAVRSVTPKEQVLLALAARHQPAALLVADAKSRYLAANDSAVELLGFSEQELRQMTVADIAVADADGALYEQFVEEGSQRGMTPVRRKDGSVLLIRYEATDIPVGSTAIYVSVIHPVRELDVDGTPQQLGGRAKARPRGIL